MINRIPFQTSWACLALILCLALEAEAKIKFFEKDWGNVIVNTDMTPMGRALPRPSPDNPVFYKGASLGTELGNGIPGDKQPDQEQLSRFVGEVMKQQGYFPAIPDQNEPELYLVLQWGYLEPQRGSLLWFLGYDPDQDIARSNFPGSYGPEVYRENLRSREISTIVELSKRPVYGIIVTAFDYASANTPNPVLFWQTRIALAADGKSMAQAMPAMVYAAGPSIGRETGSAVLRDVNPLPEGVVEMGDLEEIGSFEIPDAPDPGVDLEP